MTKDARTLIRISSELLQKVGEIADDMGVSRSSLMTMYIAQGVKRDSQQNSLLSAEGMAQIFNSLDTDKLVTLKQLGVDIDKK